MIYPDFYCNKITDVTVKLLKENDIRGLILDIDNTIIDYDRNMLYGVIEWLNEIKANDIKCIIVSNTNKIDKVEKVSKDLDIPYIYFANKPLKRGYKKAKKQLNLEYKNIAGIGDQIFTDIIGANRCKMFSILVNPISPKERFLTRVKRPLEGSIIKRYVKKQTRKD